MNYYIITFLLLFSSWTLFEFMISDRYFSVNRTFTSFIISVIIFMCSLFPSHISNNELFPAQSHKINNEIIVQTDGECPSHLTEL
jgi:hypothetical protein